MKKKDSAENDEMRPEYDFHGGVRGKHPNACRKGYSVKIHKADGTTVVQRFKSEDNYNGKGQG